MKMIDDCMTNTLDMKLCYDSDSFIIVMRDWGRLEVQEDEERRLLEGDESTPREGATHGIVS